MKADEQTTISTESIVLPLTFSLFKGGYTTIHPSSITLSTPAQIKKFFESPPRRAKGFQKRNLPCWSPALYPPGSTRKNLNVEALSCIVFDYDGPGWSPKRMIEELKSLEIASALYTTWSHNEVHEHRYRVVIFLDRVIMPDELPFTRERALGLIGYDKGIDGSCKDLARHYIVPVARVGSAFESYLNITSPPLCVDSLMAKKKTAKAKATKTKQADSSVADPQGGVTGEDTGQVLTPQTSLFLDEPRDESATVEELMTLGQGKHKCCCPFQAGSSFGSAFLRVMNDGRAFLMCTSNTHTDHQPRNQFWLRGEEGTARNPKKGKSGPHSVLKRKVLLEEVGEKLKEYVSENIVFNAPQNVFYRRDDGAWQIGSPLRMDGIKNHLIGKLTDGLDGRHVGALIDNLLAHQVYGFDCDSARGAIVQVGAKGVAKLNLYAQPDWEPVKGKYPRIDWILDVLVSGDEKGKDWLTHWAGAIAQRPERRSMVAVLCMSPQQGIGKSMFGRVLGNMIGERNSTVVSNTALKDSFNASYVTKLLVLADEVGIGRGNTDVVAALKAYITDDRIPCRAPYAARTEIENRMTWWMTSNERRPLSIDKDDRRFTVLMPKVSGKSGDKYKQMLSKCFNPHNGKYSKSFQEEVSAFAHDLHAMKVDYKLISRPYAAPARQLLQEASRGSIDQFIDMMEEIGGASILSEYPPGAEYGSAMDALAIGKGIVPCELFYGSFCAWASKNGRRDVYPESSLRLGMMGINGVGVAWVRSGGRSFQAYTGLPSAKSPEKSRSNNTDNVIEMPVIQAKAEGSDSLPPEAGD
tara:strand:- start:3047 stop:5470 length:2424 start_codon:yes stop_codon:yes gene_type:complete